MTVLDKVKNGLIVSCQALEDEPLHGPMFMAAMARAAALGGAVGIRTEGVQEVEVCKKITGLPVIGIRKVCDAAGRICITPTFNHAKDLVEAGADIVAIDCRHDRPLGEPLEELIPRVRNELGVLVMADCATYDDAQRAAAIGVDVISTTFGFVDNSIGIEPDFELLKALQDQPIPVIAEGGYWSPEEATKALSMGAWAVVIGSAITRPMEITKRFVKAIEKHKN